MRRASKIAGFAALLALTLTAGPLTGSASAAACNVPGTYATLQLAVADTSCDPIVIAAGTFNGSTGVNRAVTIIGAGAGQTVLVGSNTFTTFDTGGGATIAATGLTITHNPGQIGTGVAVQTGVTLNLSDTVVSGNTDSGVSVSQGILNLTRSSIVGNTSAAAFFAGAGISVSNGTLNASDSTVSGNRATNTTALGGGVAITGLASVVALTNSTISGNSTNDTGGGLWDGDATSVTLTNVTIAGNGADADASGTGDGGGVDVDTTTPIRLRNTIVANNTDPGGQAPDCGTTGGGNLTRLGYVLLRSQTGCTLGGTGDVATGYQTGVDPLLGPLASNGGPTQTMALPAGSPAIDAIPVASCAVTTDQRGVSRPQGSGCDIGAFELQPPGPVADTTPPETEIDKAKINRAKRKAKFKFSSSEAGSTFLCKLDRKKFKPCSSPKRYKHLKPGKHKFQVEAKDSAGNVDPTPAKRKFRI